MAVRPWRSGGATDADLTLGLAAAAFAAGATAGADFDLEQLAERIDALVQIAAVIDELAVAEERALLAFAGQLAAPDHLGLAIGEAIGLALHLAVQVGVDLAGALAAGFTGRRSVGLGQFHVAGALAAGAAASLAAGHAFGAVLVGLAAGLAATPAIGLAGALAVELAGFEILA